jgi:two-component system chemotaxis sensor kinase CheA
MKLTLRFVILIAGLLAAVAASTESGLSATTRLDRVLSLVVDSDMERLLSITHARRVFRSLVVLERDYILAKSADERDAMDTKTAALSTELSEHLDAYAKRMLPEDAATLADIRGVRERFIALNARVRAAARSDVDAALGLSKEHAKDPVSWEKAIGGLVKLSEERLSARVKETHDVYITARSRLIWVSGLAALLAGGLGYFILLGIRRNVAEVVSTNENLEGLVKARTESLSQRERALRLVLDSTGDGLFEVARNGLLTGSCSAAAVRWFGTPEPGKRLADYLFPDDPNKASLFAMAFEQLAEDILPWDLCHDQLPRRVTRGSRVIELELKRVVEQGEFAKVLVVARDVTDSVQSEKLERDTREQSALITKLLQDKHGFAQFVKDTEALLSALGACHDLTLAKRDLHTLKGNSAIFGLGSIAELCHRIEDRVAESAALPTASEVADLAGLWRTRLQSIEQFLSALTTTRLEIDLQEHTRLIDQLLKRQDCHEIVDMVELWSWPRTAERLTRLRGHVEHLAQRLGKNVEVSIEHNDLRLPSDYLEKFWPTLIHVVRNAIDHAAEPSAQREAVGKPAATKLSLTTSTPSDDSFVIEISDDGPGVDREALLRSARSKFGDLPADIEVKDLMFMDGVSSRTEVTQTSGRGVGLAAVRQACEADGGTVEVMTQPGKGTTFRFRFRRPVVKPGALVARLARRWSLRPTLSMPANANSSPVQRSSKPARGEHA